MFNRVLMNAASPLNGEEPKSLEFSGKQNMEAGPGIEPRYTALQAAA